MSMLPLAVHPDLQGRLPHGQGRAAEAVGREGGISFDIPENTTVALVGESGSGKSVTAMSVLNLLPDNAERSGRILWQGRTCCRPAWPNCRRCAARRSPASSRTR
jgi:peptide/nickel transport system ATP-binding protein